MAGLYAKRVGVNLMVLGGLVGALAGAFLLVWNPSQYANLLAVALIGFSIAPIFPALMSGTSQRVGDTFCGQHHWHANGCDRFGNGSYPQSGGSPGAPDFIGNRSHLHGCDVCRVVWFVYAGCQIQPESIIVLMLNVIIQPISLK